MAWAFGLATRELTVFAAIGMLIGGCDDLAVDLLWLARAWWRRRAIFTRFPRATMATLSPPRDPGRLAVFIPAWDEAAVIGAMLRTALDRWQRADVRIFVGTYPNDPKTIAIVQGLGDDRLRLVDGDLPGPTSKAECLNRIWLAMLAEEQRSGVRFKGVVLHDAEDVVHAQELALYDNMLERFDLVQIPVFPLGAHGRGFWAQVFASVYQDEFADGHGRQLVIREAIGASVPLAGVGCAIRREMLWRVGRARGGLPFDADSLTEDYELGLQVAALGGRGAFVTIPPAEGALPVAVRAHFPERWRDTVRQKARWTTGIALAGWDRLGWRGGLAERWMRFRDRRAPIAALVMAAAYLAFTLTLLGWPLGLTLSGRWLGVLLIATTALTAWRLAIRAVAVSRVYGLRAGLWAMPRMFVASIVSIAAVLRALRTYRPGQPMRWDKTEHVFPGEPPCG